MRVLRALAALALLSFSAEPASLPQRVQARIDELRTEAGFPGVTVGIALEDGKTIAASSVLKPTDRMLAGSTGKTFAATVILRAVESGKLDLDSKIERWVGTQYGFDRLPNAHALTLRLLLSHRSGVPDYVLDKEFAAAIAKDLDKNWTASELVAYLYDKKPLFEPGTEFAYSDANFVVAGWVYEIVTGKKLFAEVERQLVRPLKLKHTVPSESRDMTDLVSGRLNPRTPFGLDGMTIEDGRLKLNAQSEYAGGGMISNSADLARWAKLLWEGKLFSKHMLADVLDAKPTGIGRGGGKDAKYGLAVQVQPSEFGATYAHAGWFPGYQTEMVYFPDRKTAIALQVNADPGLGFKKSPHACLLEIARVVFQP